MQCSITNLAPLPRRGWATLTVPRRKAAKLPVECTFLADDGVAYRAVRGRDVNRKTVFRVHVTIGGAATITGRITPEASGDVHDSVRTHPWTHDVLQELLPAIGVQTASGPIGSVQWSRLERIDQIPGSPAHARFRVQQRLPQAGLYFTFVVDLLDKDPVAPFVGRIVWSDRLDANRVRRFDHLVWRAGEVCAFDFARRYGIQEPVPEKADWLQLLNSEPITFRDGMALVFRGRMLAFDSRNPGAVDDPADWSQDTVADFASLQAAAHGPLLGVCHEWDGEWLACGNVPRLRAAFLAGEEAQWKWDAFVKEQAQYGGWLAPRMCGLGVYPGQTGKQEDFGATKGTAAVRALDARALLMFANGADGDALRGYTHHEAHGVPIDLALHPQLRTWNRVPHFSTIVSPDQLGKSGLVPFGPNEWQGVDDEHNSANYLAAHLMLNDDPILEEQLEFLLKADQASYRMVFPQNGQGATRAQGRTAGAWAQLACVADGRVAVGFAELMAKRFLWTSQVDTFTHSGPLRVPSVGGPDPRKPLFDDQNRLVPWASMWELGLFVVGCAQAVLSGEREGQAVPRARQVLEQACETLVRFGFFKHEGKWRTVGDVAYNEGQGPIGGLTHPSRQLTSWENAPEVGSWTFAGLVCAREVLGPQHARYGELNDYILAITEGDEAETFEQAEWWAVAKAINPAIDPGAAGDVVQPAPTS